MTENRDELIPMPRGGIQPDWQHWALVYQRRLRKLKKLICAEGYDIHSDENGMPTEVVKVLADIAGSKP